MKKISVILTIIFYCASAISAQVKYINPLIGTDGMGHTFPGACVPFGIVQLSPDTDTIPHNVNGKYQKDVYKYCAGYQYQDPTIVGFSHTHFSGTGHSDLGDILFMPCIGDLKLNPGTSANPDSGYRSRFNHDSEIAKAGYYKVKLEDYNITAELTATERVGIHKYTYPKDSLSAEAARVIIDLNHGIYNYDGKTLWAMIRVENDTLITGYRITNGWARTNYTYFAASFSKPIKNYGYKDHEKISYNGWWRKFNVNNNFPEMAGKKLVSYFEFDTEGSSELVVKVALSATSTDGALKNLKVEASERSFEELASLAQEKWDKEMSVFEIEGTEDQKAMFYTSLYHTMINPSIYMDVDGKYRGLDHNIHHAEDFTNYTVFSLWDTYRAEHPLLMLLKPQQATDMVKSMIKHQNQSAHRMLPIWSHMGNDNWCMSGYHATSVIADAINKGADIDKKEALKAMVTTSKVKYYDAIGEYIKLGYVPLEASNTAASTTLEYSYDDWSIYQTALELGDEKTAREYKDRALNYQNIYDTELGFARPKYADGRFKENFDILQTHGEGFIEGNSMNFSFHVSHDVNGIMKLMGGEDVFIEKLDKLFEMHLPEKYYAANEDITQECLIGGYVHGNEPSHHIPYLYAWTKEPWKSQSIIRKIMNQMYKNEIRGLSGNDDCGQMSAWYIFSAMGFYPVCPGSGEYIIGSPYLPYIKLKLPNGNTLEIQAPKVSDKRPYVHSVKLNGKYISRNFITHEELLQGGVLEFKMSSKPNKKRGISPKDTPYSLSENWENYNVGNIHFEDKAPKSEGSRIYHSLINNPEKYISSVAREVINTLYFSKQDSIVPVNNIYYSLEDIDGVSAKGGGNGEISIFYSTRHIEKSFRNTNQNTPQKTDLDTSKDELYTSKNSLKTCKDELYTSKNSLKTCKDELETYMSNLNTSIVNFGTNKDGLDISKTDLDTNKVFLETRGVLLHELTHAYQLEPQGIGTYSTNKTFWAFIEGMADAVRISNGGFQKENIEHNLKLLLKHADKATYMDGYQTTGHFLVWIKENIDSDFLRKFNQSTLHIIPWSFNKAIKYSLGEEYDIDKLWEEYISHLQI